jgi:hypothetical protein
MKRFISITVMLMLAVSFAVAQNTLSAYTTVEEPRPRLFSTSSKQRLVSR